jgi:hypothetical protein
VVVEIPILSGYATLRHVRVSLPLVPALVADQPDKYWRPETLPPPESKAERPPAAVSLDSSPRAPSLRVVVNLALKCDGAEELGQQLHRRTATAPLGGGPAWLSHLPRRGRLLCCGFTGPS